MSIHNIYLVEKKEKYLSGALTSLLSNSMYVMAFSLYNIEKRWKISSFLHTLDIF